MQLLARGPCGWDILCYPAMDVVVEKVMVVATKVVKNKVKV